LDSKPIDLCTMSDVFRLAHRRLGLSLAIVLTIGGCSQPKFYPVRGKVIIFAVGPLTEGEIRFRPVSRPNLVGSGRIQKDGTFSVSTPEHGEGVLEGDCQVAIVFDPASVKRPIADRYSDFSTSGLSYTIAPREENFFILDVKKAGK
jgi:hypothetical protein